MVAVEAVTWVQLTTRIPQSLHRELKLHCVTVGVSVMEGGRRESSPHDTTVPCSSHRGLSNVGGKVKQPAAVGVADRHLQRLVSPGRREAAA